jgi:hypothetical protein
MNEVAQAELSPSSVAFLYAHRFAPAAKAGEMGTVSLANDAVVQTTSLCRMVVIIALWSLTEADVIVLEPFKEKRLRFIPWTGVRARLIEPIEISGVEGDIVAKLARDKKGRDPGMDVATLVHLLFKDMRGKVAPELLVRKRLVDELVELGYAERVSTDVGAVKHALTGKSRAQLQGRRDQIESVKEPANRLVESWNRFSREQPELKDELIVAVRDAFNRIQPDRGGWDD